MAYSLFSFKPPASDEAAERGGRWLRVRQLWAKDSLRHAVLSVVDQGIVSGTNFATSVVIGRLCSQTEMGVYALGISLVYFARAIQEQVVSAPYTIYCNRKDPADRAVYAGSSWVHFLFFSVAVGCLLLGLSGVLAVRGGSADLLRLTLALAGVLPLFLLREFIRHFTFSHLKIRTAVLLDLAVSGLQLTGLCLLGFGGVLTVPLVFAVIGASCLLAGGGWLLLKNERFVVSRASVLADWKQNWGFARWALACQLVGCSAPYVMPWFVASMEGTAATGILAASTTLVGLANTFVMGLANYLSPLAAKAHSEGGTSALRPVLLTTALIFLATLGTFAVATCFLGSWIAVLVYGASYCSAGPVIAVLAFGALASSLSLTAGNGLWAIDRPAANFRADLCALVVTIVFSVLLIGPWGVLGAALATTLGASVDALVRGWILVRHLGRRKDEG